MGAYVIASYDIVDQEGYKDYVPGVLPLLTKHGGQVVAADYNVQTLEGDKRSVYVILKFNSEEAALNWYNDPEYKDVKKIRMGSCNNNNLVLAKPFVQPRA